MKNIILLLLLLARIDLLVGQTAVNDYPYPASTCAQCTSGVAPCVAADNYQCYKYNCTSFCAWRLERDHNCFLASCTTKTKILFTSSFGNAKDWGTNFAAKGYYISDVPTPGSIIYYTASQSSCTGIGASGHVAYVESVTPKGGGTYDFTVSQYNGGSCTFKSSNHTVSPSISCKPRFIRFNRFELISPTAQSVTQGGTLNLTLQVKDDLGGAVNNVEFRCGLYDSDNRLIGEIARLTKTFTGKGSSQTLSFSKQLYSCPGSYKIWIESKLVGASSNTPWVLLHTIGNVSSVMPLTVNTPTSNNEYSTATSLVVKSSDVYTFGSNCTATLSTTPSITSSTSCPITTSSKDVWFRFTPAVAGYYTAKSISYSITDVIMAVYSSSSASGTGLSLIGCNDDKSSSDKMSYLSFYASNTNPVFIRVWGKGSLTGAFGICVRTGASAKKDEEDTISSSKTPNLDTAQVIQSKTNSVSTAINEVNYSIENVNLKAYPNPFTSELNFVIDLPQSGKGNLKIINEAGQMVRELFNDNEFQQGENKFAADINDLAEGFYLGVLEINGNYKSIRLIKSSRGARGGNNDEAIKAGAARFEEMEKKFRANKK